MAEVLDKSKPGVAQSEPSAKRGFGARARRAGVVFGQALIPIILAMIVNGIILAIMGRNPLDVLRPDVFIRSVQHARI